MYLFNSNLLWNRIYEYYSLTHTIIIIKYISINNQYYYIQFYYHQAYTISNINYYLFTNYIILKNKYYYRKYSNCVNILLTEIL